MKQITKILGLMLLLLFFSCVQHASKEKKERFKLDENFEYVNLIPDSLRTPDSGTTKAIRFDIENDCY